MTHHHMISKNSQMFSKFVKCWHLDAKPLQKNFLHKSAYFVRTQIFLNAVYLKSCFQHTTVADVELF